MKILFGIPIKTHNEISIAEVAEFKNRGIKTDVSYYGNSGEVKGYIKSIILVFKNAINISRKAKLQNSDIVYLNTAIDRKTLVRDSITIFIIKTFNKHVNIILKTHGTLNSVILTKFNPLKYYVFKQASLLLVLSKEEYFTLLKSGVNSNKIKITANAIDKTKYSIDKEFRNSYNLSNKTLILLYAGRFILEKGILDIINACQLIKSSIEFQLFCLGDGPLFTEVNNLVHKLDLSNKVTFLGHIAEKDTKYFYSNCDILLLPTYHPEGFPMAVFQALAAGKPIITTKIRAAADHLTEYKNCLWVTRNDPGDLSKKILILGNDPQLRETMRSYNLLLANTFTAKRITDNLLPNFKTLVRNSENRLRPII